MTPHLSFGPQDIAPAEPTEKVAAARERFRLEEVTTREGFDLGYRLLDAEFGPANELERREVLERWFERSLSPEEDPIAASYHMVIARDRDGRVAAVRDSFVAVDRRVPRVVTLMSHSLVLPEWRRTGIASLLRAAPVVHARRAAPAGAELLVVAEMEMPELDQPQTVIRLVAYGRAGFRVVPPWRVRYAQPDFRDVQALGVAPLPLPFLLLVRQVGEEDRTSLSSRRAIALVDHLDAIHRPSTSSAQLLAIRAVALRGIAPDGPDLDLVALPRSPDDREGLAPLLRSRLLPLYPPEWHGTPQPREGQP